MHKDGIRGVNLPIVPIELDPNNPDAKKFKGIVGTVAQASNTRAVEIATEWAASGKLRLTAADCTYLKDRIDAAETRLDAKLQTQERAFTAFAASTVPMVEDLTDEGVQLRQSLDPDHATDDSFQRYVDGREGGLAFQHNRDRAAHRRLTEAAFGSYNNPAANARAMAMMSDDMRARALALELEVKGITRYLDDRSLLHEDNAATDVGPNEAPAHAKRPARRR